MESPKVPNNLLRSLLVKIAPYAIGIAVATSIVAPKGTAWWFPLFGVVALASVDFRNFAAKLTDRAAGLIAVLIAVYLFASLAWTADRRETLGTALLYSLYLAATWYAVKGLLADREAAVGTFGLAALAGFIAGAIFIGVELLNGNALQKLVFTACALFAPGIARTCRHGQRLRRFLGCRRTEPRRGRAEFPRLAGPAICHAEKTAASPPGLQAPPFSC